MKRKIKYLSVLLVAFITVLSSCSTDDGVGSYAIDATPTLISVEPGYERVRVKWKANATSADASTSNVYWSGGDKSSGMFLTTGDNEFELIIEDVAEGTQTFYVQNATSTQNKYSAPSNEITIEVYGSTYSASLATRAITEVTLDSSSGAEITWGTASSAMIGTAVYYSSNAGGEAEAFFPSSDDSSIIEDALCDTEFSYTTLYLPVSNCLDSIPSKRISGEAFPESADGIIKVSSPVMMAQYMKEDNVNVLLETGDYRIDLADYNNELYPYYINVVSEDAYTHSFFLVRGSGSTYDFGGSTITVSLDVYDAYANETFPIHFIGNNNVVKNLTQIDEGEAERKISGGVTNVTMDGSNNTLQSVTIHNTGSYPYGYGELFGKGGNNVINHRKHCGILVRGNYNTVKACSLYNKVFGHGIFMQAAEDITITDCYVEGAMRTTNDLLSEVDTEAAAVDFLTYWGFTTPANFTYSLMEDGIRIYNSGNTMINGIRYNERASKNCTVTGCYVKNAREGIVLDSVEGTSEVEDCTAVGCDLNFSIQDGHILRCFADCQYGPAFEVAHGFNNITIDITLLPHDDNTTINGFAANNGSGQLANIYGYSNTIYLKAHETLKEDDINTQYVINFGGKNNRIGSQDPWDERYNHTGRNNYFYNETTHPVVFWGDHPTTGNPMSYGNTVETAGAVYYSNVDGYLFPDSDGCASYSASYPSDTVTIIPFAGEDDE